ncbi:unnamed protein product [Ceutorhynchus assimilis]|uniref:Chitin-binding type-2 domain-containing protein n=1 Tax=Ceutorhynchus assimilis TaxID=467358 RepID=A0A9P0DGI7_9CUCU|nr:unnamed protein product [Ceutorhynchus assimilis]
MVPTYVVAAILLSATLFGFAESQRKVARPLPTVSETKERARANFDCPEEFGYYPHPSDCTQYYVCVFGGALLESCTGGLMYSHELQTCDWPRNVGCDGLEIAGPPLSAPASQSSGSQGLRSRERERLREREKEEVRGESARSKYSPQPPPPPPQPKAIVTSRGQPRQLQNQEIIKQIYDEVEEALPPAEEVESDRQQRVYRGQPSLVGQVQRDRDGYRHTNALPTYKDRGEKIGVISFGTQSQLQHYSEEKSTVSQPPAVPTATATARTLYNSSQYNNINQNDNRYDPFYPLYDEDVELYKDVDYTPQNNNNYNTNSPSTRGTTPSVYRGSPAREESTKRGNVVYNNVNQDIYQQPSTVSDYSDNSYQEEDTGYKQSSRSPSRTSSRGRGTSHYTNSASIASNEVTVNRGTPAPRSRPTLKPSTSIVSKATEFIDIYKNPPRRPDPIYPQPQPDKTAAKCRKDVCLLPDCSCGGKDIPGDIPVEQVPQMVILTFDDSVNDLNKGLYQDLFERGRTNPNGCPIAATFYVSHEWTDYSQVQNLYSDGHELASHTVSHSFGEQFSQKKWTREVAGQREILSAYGGVKLEDVRGMRAPFLSVGGNKMFKMLYDSNFTYDSSMPIYENKPPSWPYTLDYKLFHDCMIPPCPTRSYPGVWEVPMVMWQDLNGGRCSMGDACSNPPDADGVFKMLIKNFQRHYTTNRAPFGLFYHAAWFTQPHHKEGFITFIDTILAMKDVWLLTNWQALQWVRDPTPTSRLNNFQPFQCDYADRPKRCNNPKVCNLWHKSGVRYMRTCQPCPDIYPWTGNTGIRSSRIDNDIED